MYVRASRELNYDTDDPVTRFASTRPWSMPALDGALALIDPSALLRKKVLLMAAVLESQPEYCDAFLPRDRPLSDLLSVAVAVARGVVLAAAGLLLLRFVR